MLKGQNIMYFSNDWAADNRTSSHHIVRQLAKHNKVLYVESSGLRAPKASSHDLFRLLRRLRKMFRAPRKVHENIFVISPFLLPFHKYPIVKKINQHLLIRRIKGDARKLELQDPILWIIIPHMAVVAGRLNEKMVVYYCVDDYSSFPGVDATRIAEYDAALTKKANIIFAPAETIYRKKRNVNPSTFLSPHGVDIPHFSKVFDDTLLVPEDIKEIAHPIIGYFGLIEKWIDLELIRYLSENKPEYSFVMIGRVAQDISAFKNINNVHFLGSKAYKDLPKYGRLFDATIIPYVLDYQVHNCNPIKLREYLAMGKPVISVRTPETEKFSDVIEIADSHDEFSEKIKRSLSGNDEAAVTERRTRVKDLSWENRFAEISETIEDSLVEDNDLSVLRREYECLTHVTTT